MLQFGQGLLGMAHLCSMWLHQRAGWHSSIWILMSGVLVLIVVWVPLFSKWSLQVLTLASTQHQDGLRIVRLATKWLAFRPEHKRTEAAICHDFLAPRLGISTVFYSILLVETHPRARASENQEDVGTQEHENQVAHYRSHNSQSTTPRSWHHYLFLLP